jgi:hypothetical protein
VIDLIYYLKFWRYNAKKHVIHAYCHNLPLRVINMWLVLDKLWFFSHCQHTLCECVVIHISRYKLFAVV